MAVTFFAPNNDNRKELARPDERSILQDLASELHKEVKMPLDAMLRNKTQSGTTKPELLNNMQECLEKIQDVRSMIEAGLGITAEVVKQVAQANNPAAGNEQSGQAAVNPDAGSQEPTSTAPAPGLSK